MLKVGLTGGIGSGKSAVSSLFEEWGAFIFKADIVAKDCRQIFVAKDILPSSHAVVPSFTPLPTADS